jgi:hypothetical protein
MQQELEHKQREEEDALYRKFLQVSIELIALACAKT